MRVDEQEGMFGIGDTLDCLTLYRPDALSPSLSLRASRMKLTEMAQSFLVFFFLFPHRLSFYY